MKREFDHEKLAVYQQALDFVKWATRLLGEVEAKAAVKDQLDRASTSVVLNLAEGNGKFSPKDRVRFLQIAMGSAMECAACLDVFVAKGILPAERIAPGKEELLQIVSMLSGLIAWHAARVRDEPLSYGFEEKPEENEKEKE